MKPFQLVGGRDYVQGSQMVARAAEMVGSGAVLTGCAFRRLVAEQVRLHRIAQGETLPENACGDATFQTGDAAYRVAFSPIGEPAERVAESACWSLREIAVPAGLSGDFAFEGAEDFEALMEIVIRALKRLHSGLAVDAHDIWFTGCRKSELAITPPASSGTLMMRPLRVMVGRPAHQTLTSVALDFGGNMVQRAVISFAFQSGQFAHAA